MRRRRAGAKLFLRTNRRSQDAFEIVEMAAPADQPHWPNRRRIVHSLDLDITEHGCERTGGLAPEIQRDGQQAQLAVQCEFGREGHVPGRVEPVQAGLAQHTRTDHSAHRVVEGHSAANSLEPIAGTWHRDVQVAAKDPLRMTFGIRQLRVAVTKHGPHISFENLHTALEHGRCTPIVGRRPLEVLPPRFMDQAVPVARRTDVG